MKARLQADADLRHAIVRGVVRRSPGMDFRGAAGATLEGLADAAVLAFAAEGDRVLVSHDVTTMPKHFREFVTFYRSPGLLLISQRVSTAKPIEDLVLLWELLDADEMVNRAYRVPGLFRIFYVKAPSSCSPGSRSGNRLPSISKHDNGFPRHRWKDGLKCATRLAGRFGFRMKPALKRGQA